MAKKFDIKELLLDKGERIGLGVAGGLAVLAVLSFFYTAFTGTSAAANKQVLDDQRQKVEARKVSARPGDTDLPPKADKSEALKFENNKVADGSKYAVAQWSSAILIDTRLRS